MERLEPATDESPETTRLIIITNKNRGGTAFSVLIVPTPELTSLIQPTASRLNPLSTLDRYTFGQDVRQG